MTTPQPDPQEIHYLVKKLRDKIMQDRDEYKSLLVKLYTLKPPFTPGRSASKQEFAYELKQYIEMIGHCLIIGDSDILYRFGIQPIEQDATILVKHSNLDSYINAFSKRLKDSTSEGEKFYLAMLIRAFKSAKGEKASANITRVD